MKSIDIEVNRVGDGVDDIDIVFTHGGIYASHTVTSEQARDLAEKLICTANNIEEAGSWCRKAWLDKDDCQCEECRKAATRTYTPNNPPPQPHTYGVTAAPADGYELCGRDDAEEYRYRGKLDLSRWSPWTKHHRGHIEYSDYEYEYRRRRKKQEATAEHYVKVRHSCKGTARVSSQPKEAKQEPFAVDRERLKKMLSPWSFGMDYKSMYNLTRFLADEIERLARRGEGE